MLYFSQIPAGYPDQTVLGSYMADGTAKDGAALGITQVNEADMRARTDLLDKANKAFNVSRATQETAYDHFHGADEALDSWMGKVTGTLGAFFGKRWNRQWVAVGFIKPSIRIPDALADRISLSKEMIGFLAANPDKEAPNQGVTAANGTTLRQAVLTTQKLALEADDDVTNKGTARETASTNLTSYMRTLIGVLAELLNADDTRWHDFGLEIPASVPTPAAPSGLAVVANPTEHAAKADKTSVLLTWDATPFATRYRVRRRFVGMLGADWELVASTTEPMAQVEVPANATVEFIVQAVNEDRQSVPSDAVAFGSAVNAATAQPTSVPSETPVAIVAPANGTNGHANGSRLPALQ